MTKWPSSNVQTCASNIHPEASSVTRSQKVPVSPPCLTTVPWTAPWTIRIQHFQGPVIITLGRRVLDSWLIKCEPSRSLLPRGIATGSILGSHSMSPRTAVLLLAPCNRPEGLFNTIAGTLPRIPGSVHLEWTCWFALRPSSQVKTTLLAGEPHFFIIYLFIYFWLCWVFVGVRRLYWVSASGDYSSLQWGAQAIGMWASVTAARGLSSCHSWALECVGLSSYSIQALEHGSSSCCARAQLPHSVWDIPGPGIEPLCPALAGRFLTTGPPGKSWGATLFENCRPRQGRVASNSGFSGLEIKEICVSWVTSKLQPGFLFSRRRWSRLMILK